MLRRHSPLIPVERFSLNIVRNAKNLGNCLSRNRGVALATGDYIIVIDPDCIVNRRFVRSHVHQHLKGFDVVLGPMGIESGGGNAQDLVETLESLGAVAIAPRMRLQDASTPASGVNCVTRNFSVSREMLKRLGRPLFDERYAYRNSPDTGFGWEDVEMGASLRRLGARIAFSWDAFSVHMSHGSTVNDRVKARGSAKNFIRLIEEHPELLEEAPDWAEVTAARIAKWQKGFEPPESGLSEIVRDARATRSKNRAADVTVYSAVAGGYDRVRTPRGGLAKRHVLFTDNADRVCGLGRQVFCHRIGRSGQDRKGAKGPCPQICGRRRLERLDRRQCRTEHAGAKPYGRGRASRLFNRRLPSSGAILRVRRGRDLHQAGEGHGRAHHGPTLTLRKRGVSASIRTGRVQRDRPAAQLTPP